jgi:hypothetical protein
MNKRMKYYTPKELKHWSGKSILILLMKAKNSKFKTIFNVIFI